MLTPQLTKKIEDYVYGKPRSIQEIAAHINKNWRTADRYVSEIEEQYGTVSTRVFREGTRGALKIVYWSSVEKVSSSVFQEQLEAQLMQGRTKYDFSPFDIFQHIPDKKKEAAVTQRLTESDYNIENLQKLLLKAQKQLLIFSGNLSFINFKDSKNNAFSALDELVKRGVTIKIISRVDLAGKENIEKALSLNFKYNKELVEIHHREQPLRAIIIDKTLANFKEVKEPTGRFDETQKKTFLFYTIQDKEWIEWLSQIFWKMFSSSVDANVRLSELNKIRGSDGKSLRFASD